MATSSKRKILFVAAPFPSFSASTACAQAELGTAGPSYTWLTGHGRFPEKALACYSSQHVSLQRHPAGTHRTPEGAQGDPGQPVRASAMARGEQRGRVVPGQ